MNEKLTHHLLDMFSGLYRHQPNVYVVPPGYRRPWGDRVEDVLFRTCNG